MNAATRRSLYTSARPAPEVNTYSSIYFALFDGFNFANPVLTHGDMLPGVRNFLRNQLRQARHFDVNFPSTTEQMEAWLHADFIDSGRVYQRYLSERRAGAAPRYLKTTSHAIDFLQKSAPTKLVDGSWLYGLLPRWNEPAFRNLIRIYLEELGDGVAQQNHVAIYRKLLAEYSVDDWTEIDDKYFRQGAIQLALAAMADDFLPEVLGFNLGYEQLPSHLPITAYELAELGVDPYYFTLHITIDNFDNGHARRALASIMSLIPTGADAKDFLQRVRNGYQLNFLGEGASAIAHSFDLERELIALLTRKAEVGQYLHCDRCRIQGMGINEWLARPGGIPDLLHALESSGWIRRHQDPANSRFWHLIDGERPLMFGVFDAREKQIVFDWISGDWRAPRSAQKRVGSETNRSIDRTDQATTLSINNFLQTYSQEPRKNIDDCIRYMSPALHATAEGLAATRQFAEHFYRQPQTQTIAPMRPLYHA